MMIKITAMLSQVEDIILQFYIIPLIILFGFSSNYSFSYLSIMKSV